MLLLFPIKFIEKRYKEMPRISVLIQHLFDFITVNTEICKTNEVYRKV